MTTRVLPPDEWDRLAETDLGQTLDRLPAEAVTVFVVEDGPEIVGCWALITFAHVEGLWIAPSHRKRGRVLLHLWNRLRAIASAKGIGAVFTGAATEDVRRLLEGRQAAQMPPMYVLPLRAARE